MIPVFTEVNLLVGSFGLACIWFVCTIILYGSYMICFQSDRPQTVMMASAFFMAFLLTFGLLKVFKHDLEIERRKQSNVSVNAGTLEWRQTNLSF